jgi:DNA/RNA endonuclease YhcR with UshA esterase domain
MRVLLCKVLVLFVLTAPLLAQKAATDNPRYDAKSEVTLTGTIDDVKDFTAAKGEVGTLLVLKTSAETIDVRLCPNSFLKEFEVTFNKGDKVEVTGSKVTIEDKPVILAREIVLGNNTLVLRDKQGVPVWTWLKHG